MIFAATTSCRWPGQDIDRRFQDNGPSFVYRVRQRDGTAREYQNYMLPVEVNDRRYFLSGVRSAQAEEFRYLYVPVDDNDSPQRFMQLLAAA
jgi:cytochrome c biogenesis protein